MKVKKLIVLALSTLVCLILAAGIYLYFKDTAPPQVVLTPDSGPVGLGTTFTARAEDPSGVRSMVVVLIQNGKRSPLGSTPPGKTTGAELSFDLSQAGFKSGNFTLEVTSVDGSYFNFGKGNATVVNAALTLDNIKPQISVESLQHNLNRGGCGAISYTVNEAVSGSGVRVGDRFFKGYQLPSGKYACLFAFPYDVEPADFRPELEATDLAGNMRSQTFAFHANNRSFPQDTLNLPDSFLQAKMPQYEELYPNEPDLLSLYLKVNGELRIKDQADILTLGQTSASEPLWQGVFLRLPNAANRAGFGDKRTYRYNGQDVDKQTHLGIDLASLQNAQVPASNSGVVLRTGFNGIYGENVILDHGLGLMTLYSHLSQINVEQGDQVARGQIIGRTGATGLAGGDHLHYGVYVSGVAVNPLEWWDGTWIKNNISDRIGH